jgi:RNA polymerase sigma-32 factor
MRRDIDLHTGNYIGRVNAIPRLSRERELELARAWLGQGDRKAADELIQANLRHVIPMALRLSGDGRPIADLIAQGNLALVTALDRFEPERGLRFVTYAKHAIRAHMLGHVLDTRSMVGGGRGHQRGRFVFGLQRQHAALRSRHGDSERVCEELGERFGKSSAQIEDILARLDRRDGWLDAPLGDSTSAAVEQLSDDTADHCSELVRRTLCEELSGAVGSAMTELDERERFIAEYRLMADDEVRCSLSDVGQRFGVSRERARQLENRVKDKLRKRLKPLARRWDLEQTAAA